MYIQKLAKLGNLEVASQYLVYIYHILIGFIIYTNAFPYSLLTVYYTLLSHELPPFHPLFPSLHCVIHLFSIHFICAIHYALILSSLLSHAPPFHFAILSNLFRGRIGYQVLNILLGHFLMGHFFSQKKLVSWY